MSGIRESTDVGYDGLARVVSVPRKISGTSGVKIGLLYSTALIGAYNICVVKKSLPHNPHSSSIQLPRLDTSDSWESLAPTHPEFRSYVAAVKRKRRR